MDRSSDILKKCDNYGIQELDVELSELICHQPSPQLESFEDENHTNSRNYADKEVQKDGSDSGRCTPQETTASQSGSVSVRFEDILIDVINATTIHVDWCPALNNENLHGYKIRYAIKDNSSYNEVFVTPGISNYTISGLKPNTEYDVWVNAIDEQENVIHHCGGATQKTDDIEGRERLQSSPYIAVIVAAILLTTAVVVPLTVLIVAYGTHKNFDAPYLTAVAAVTLLLVAVVVPVTFLFVRNCGQCTTSASGENEVPEMVQEKDADHLKIDNGVQTLSSRHHSDVTRDTTSALPTVKRRKRLPHLWTEFIAQKDQIEQNKTPVIYKGM